VFIRTERRPTVEPSGHQEHLMPSTRTSAARDPRGGRTSTARRRPNASSSSTSPHGKSSAHRSGGARNAPSVATPAFPAARDYDVTTDGPNGFFDLGVPADLVGRLVAMDRATPFPVQHMTLTDALAGRDLCVKAPTGSGKTLAFSLPVVMRARKAEPKRPTALILAPTRELAAQIRDTIAPLAATRDRRVATVYGGTNINRDQIQLRRGVDILVATPGRLADLVDRRDVDLSEVRIVVLDEADRMADMGFLPEVVRLLDRTSEDRQTLLFSATLDGDVDTLIRRYQHDPARHTVEVEPATIGDVRHIFWAAERDARRQLTGDIVRRVEPAIVFTRTKHGADRLVKQLLQDGIAAAPIHGNRSQSQRERALDSFRKGEITTLVATDVAARGIHVDDVAVVVHYDLPGSDKDYQHRSGRTGRAGARGLVVAFVDGSQHKDTAVIQRSMDLETGLHDIDLDLLKGEGQPPIAQPFAGGQRGAKGTTAPGDGAGRTRARSQRGHGQRSRTGGAGGAARSGGARSAGSRVGGGTGHGNRRAGR
jgi:superfamily II DNA/RNA helicase